MKKLLFQFNTNFETCVFRPEFTIPPGRYALLGKFWEKKSMTRNQKIHMILI